MITILLVDGGVSWLARSTASRRTIRIEQQRMAADTIRQMWAAFGLQPRRSQTFKLSSDPLFVDKVRDIVSLRRPWR
jgi:hypothetical protein